MGPTATASPIAGARVCMLLCNPFTHDARVLKEATTLVQAGADVRVIAQEGRGLAHQEVVDGVRVTRVAHDPLPARIARAAITRAHGDAEPVALPPRSAPAGGGAVAFTFAIELALRRALVGSMYLRWSREAVRAGRREPIDLVVAHDFETLPAAWALARIAGAPYLYDSHEFAAGQEQVVPRTGLGRRRQRAVERRLAARAAAVVTVNDSIAGELERRYGIPRPHVVRNVPYAPVEVPAATGWRDAIGVPRGARVVLYVGAIFAHRGIEDAIAALAHLDAGVLLVLMGPVAPEYRRDLEEHAAAHGVVQRVRFAPPVPPAHVTAYAAAADAGVIPTRLTSPNQWLSLPNKLFEYLAACLPVVAVAFPELRRIIEGHDVGRVCPPQDPRALAEALAAVLEPAENRRLRDNAARAAAELTWERESAAYRGAVEAALATRR